MRDERGFTLIELLVAALLCSVALLAIMSTLDTSRELVTDAEVHEVATHQAERELERILALPYGSIALRLPPTVSTESHDPRYHVIAGPPLQYRWDQGATGPQSDELVVDALAGTLDPVGTWQDGAGRLSGSLHRFVTWTGDLCASCPGSQRAKRITVAVTVDGHPRPPALISSVKVDGNATG